MSTIDGGHLAGTRSPHQSGTTGRLPSRPALQGVNRQGGANLAGLTTVNIVLKFSGSERKIEVLQVEYLNNILEHDDRCIKCLTGLMPRFKSVIWAATTPAGIETAPMMRKGQLPANGLTALQQLTALAG